MPQNNSFAVLSKSQLATLSPDDTIRVSLARPRTQASSACKSHPYQDLGRKSPRSGRRVSGSRYVSQETLRPCKKTSRLRGRIVSFPCDPVPSPDSQMEDLQDETHDTDVPKTNDQQGSTSAKKHFKPESLCQRPSRI